MQQGAELLLPKRISEEGQEIPVSAAVHERTGKVVADAVEPVDWLDSDAMVEQMYREGFVKVGIPERQTSMKDELVERTNVYMSQPVGTYAGEKGTMLRQWTPNEDSGFRRANYKINAGPYKGVTQLDQNVSTLLIPGHDWPFPEDAAELIQANKQYWEYVVSPVSQAFKRGLRKHTGVNRRLPTEGVSSLQVNGVTGFIDPATKPFIQGFHTDRVLWAVSAMLRRGFIARFPDKSVSVVTKPNELVITPSDVLAAILGDILPVDHGVVNFGDENSPGVGAVRSIVAFYTLSRVIPPFKQNAYTQSVDLRQQIQSAKEFGLSDAFYDKARLEASA